MSERERESGGPAQEDSGTMTVMVFCSEYTFDRCFFFFSDQKYVSFS